MKFILASASPRRADLLRNLGVTFEVIASNIDESVLDKGLSAEEIVTTLAEKKVFSVANKLNQGLVLGADTIVVNDGMVLGKPANIEEATAMLHSLSGRQHKVYTGISLLDAENYKKVTKVEMTKVNMRKLEQKEIQTYIDTKEPFDKAGGYGIQGKGALLVKGVEGCYFNVVGLPLVLLAASLKIFGINLLSVNTKNK